MSPSRTFILRPIATSPFMAAIVLTGLVAYKQLPNLGASRSRLSDDSGNHFLPRREPGCDGVIRYRSPGVQFGQVPGLQQMTSTSDGLSVITLQFSLSLNIHVAEQEVQQSINASGTHLPRGSSHTAHLTRVIRPTRRSHFSVDFGCVGAVAGRGPCRYASHPQNLAIPGVGLVSISGGQKPAVRIRANPTALASYGLNLEDIRTALVAANVNQAKGNFDGPHQAYQIGANDQLLSSADYKPLIIAYRNGAPVKLTDVAGVTDDTENIVKPPGWTRSPPSSSTSNANPVRTYLGRRSHQAAAAATDVNAPEVG